MTSLLFQANAKASVNDLAKRFEAYIAAKVRNLILIVESNPCFFVHHFPSNPGRALWLLRLLEASKSIHFARFII